LILPFLFFPVTIFLVMIGVIIPRGPSPRAGSLLADLEKHLNSHVLFGIFPIMFGVLMMIQAYRADQLLEGYFSYCFFFSGGIGLLAGGLVHARRRPTGPWAIPADQPDSGLLASILRLPDTDLSVVLARIFWTVLGASAAIIFISLLDLSEQIHDSLTPVPLAVLVFGPGLILVWAVQKDAYGGGISARLKRLLGTRELRLIWLFLGLIAATFVMRALGVRL
jgi:hypothetical protein